MGVTRFPGATTRQQDFTSSGTWTCPSGVYSAKFLVVGAGGGGGGTSQLVTEYSQGGGGGGGAVKEIDLNVTPGTSYTITIGAKGTGGAAATAGGNGGFSEILNGATSLIKCYGGAGGDGVALGASIVATVTQTRGSGGGAGNNGAINRAAGGGGGANFSLGFTPTASTPTNGEGGAGRLSSNTGVASIQATGGPGVNGYGAGGGGGFVYSGTLIATAQGGSQYAGDGGVRSTAGVTNGGAAVANTGCGGGGAVAFLSATSTTGGNGADGLVRVVYFA